MTQTNDLQIRLKVEEMITWAYAPLRNFPKAEKHVLSAEIRQSMFRLLRLVIIVNRRYHKKTTMQDLDSELDLLRSLVRLSRELGYLPFRQYEIWARHLAEVGRMVGGWLSWARAHS